MSVAQGQPRRVTITGWCSEMAQRRNHMTNAGELMVINM